MFKNTVYLIVIIALVAVLILAGPILVIWSVLEWKEVLVNGADPWNWKLWLATLIIGVFIRSDVRITKKS